jgi:hypothetical protein
MGLKDSNGIGDFSSHKSHGFSSGLETICDHRKKCSCWQMGVPCCVGPRLFNVSHVKSKFLMSICVPSGDWPSSYKHLEGNRWHLVALSGQGWVMFLCVWPGSRKAFYMAVKKHPSLSHRTNKTKGVGRGTLSRASQKCAQSASQSVLPGLVAASQRNSASQNTRAPFILQNQTLLGEKPSSLF